MLTLLRLNLKTLRCFSCLLRGLVLLTVVVHELRNIARQRTGRVMNLFLEVKRSPVFHGQVAK